MAFDLTTDLPAIESLPLGEVATQALASDIALLADGLMSANDAPLLAISLSHAAPRQVTFWDQRLSVCDALASATERTAIYAPVLEALRDAASRLGERLLDWGWTHAGSEQLHALTDGTGVVLVIDQPQKGPGWLLKTARPGGHMPLAPLATGGVWSLIAAESRDMVLH